MEPRAAAHLLLLTASQLSEPSLIHTFSHPDHAWVMAAAGFPTGLHVLDGSLLQLQMIGCSSATSRDASKACRADSWTLSSVRNQNVTPTFSWSSGFLLQNPKASLINVLSLWIDAADQVRM